ncbi:MAG: glycoside hydrolase family 130 protein [Bacteroidota bacterium]|nr:glycoside hydrolase family 130 protein [Bacteroidota bacterium]
MNKTIIKTGKLLFFFLLWLTVAANGQLDQCWQMRGFVKPSFNPIMQADSSYTFFDPIKKEMVQWQKADVFNPAAIVRNGKVYILFRAEDIPGTAIGMRTSRIGLAVSKDGLHFTKMKNPVLYPDSSQFMQYDYPGGCEDPRIVEKEDGTYVLLYTSWNRDVARLSVATSADLIHWEKQGPAFAKAYNGKFLNVWSKSGSVVTKMVKKKIIATKVNSKYWMYWGENPMYLASSENCIDWTPVVNEQQELVVALQPRAKKFDSHLTEPGPPALITDKGILLLYNGRNIENENADPALPGGTYCGGQALFALDNPSILLERCDNYFIKPDLPHETKGQYKSGTTFVEGLVFFKGKWFLYYGTADSMVGVAVKDK